MTAKEFLIDYMKNDPSNKDSDGNPYFDTLTELFSEIGYDYEWSQDIYPSRWWKNIFAVQEINGVMVGYLWAESTGDMGIFDVGWEFDEDTICYVEPYEVTVTQYRKVI